MYRNRLQPVNRDFSPCQNVSYHDTLPVMETRTTPDSALRRWVKSSGLTVDTIADALQIHRVTLHRYMALTAMPTPRVALRIEALTQGAVTCTAMTRDFTA